MQLQSENDMVKTRAELTNTVCRIWRWLPVGYILSLYASIPCLRGSGIVGKRFPRKCRPFEAKFVRFRTENSGFFVALLQLHHRRARRLQRACLEQRQHCRHTAEGHVPDGWRRSGTRLWGLGPASPGCCQRRVRDHQAQGIHQLGHRHHVCQAGRRHPSQPG